MFYLLQHRFEIEAQVCNLFGGKENFKRGLHARAEIEIQFGPIVILRFRTPRLEFFEAIKFTVVDGEALVVDLECNEAWCTIAPHNEKDLRNDDKKTEEKVPEPNGERDE